MEEEKTEGVGTVQVSEPPEGDAQLLQPPIPSSTGTAKENAGENVVHQPTEDDDRGEDAVPEQHEQQPDVATTGTVQEAKPTVAPDASPTIAVAAASKNGSTEKNLSLSLPGTQRMGVGANAFAQLVRGWEGFMRDEQIDRFTNLQQPLQMLQGLSLCGHTVPGVPRPEQGQQQSERGNDKELPPMHPLAPPSFRYTHSSPSPYFASQYLPSMMSQPKKNDKTNEETPGDDDIPPPIALDPFQRSSSTPSAFRQPSNYSAFGTADKSAFTLPLQRSSLSGIPTTSTSSEPGAAAFSSSAFGPIQFYSMALEDMERTSIEVQDTTDRTSKGNDRIQSDDVSVEVGSKRGAASRAARFLSDVRVFRRRRRSHNRGGRENPAQPASVSSSASKGTGSEAATSPTLDTAVTVVTEPHYNPNDTSLLSTSSEVSAIVKNEVAESDAAATDCEDDNESTADAPMEEEENGAAQPGETKEDDEYDQLDDSDVEEAHYQPIEAQLQPISPPVPSPSYQTFDDERPLAETAKTDSSADAIAAASSSKMRVKISSPNKPRFTLADSPSPTGMERGEGSCLTPRSATSSRSSVTGSSSGHTTQATNNSSSSSNGLQSGLSTISETDREVMEANKEAKRRSLDNLLTKISKSENDGTSTNSSSSTSTNPNRYFSLASSPINLREGANVPVGQLLSSNRSPSPSTPGSQNGGVQLVRAHTIGPSTSASRRSGSTTSPSAASGSISAARTNSSGSSSEQPPTFVSYMDQETPVFRGESMETSSQRASGSEGEEREASPAAQMLGYSELSFEEPLAPSQVRSSRLFRSRQRRRPPRSPGKGSRLLSKTPPPRGSLSPLYHHQQLSPPPDIVDHPDSTNVSRPSYVMRSGLAMQNPVLVASRSDRGSTTTTAAPMESEEIMIKGRTYQESSIEIMNTDSADGTANLVTPEK